MSERPRWYPAYVGLGSNLNMPTRQIETALELLEKAHGSEHPEVAWAWGNLGLAAYRMREYDEALHCFDRLLAIAEPLFGESHPAIELTHVNKALARVSAGQLEEAELECRRALRLDATNAMAFARPLAAW